MAVLLACGVAQASEWASIGKSDDGKEEGFIDTSSIRISGDIRRAWVKLIYGPHTKSDPDNPKMWEREAVAHEKFNCSDETESADALTIYYEDGTVYSLSPQLLPTPWSPVPPDTMMSDDLRFVCAWKPK
jgi:hypothetical protein